MSNLRLGSIGFVGDSVRIFQYHFIINHCKASTVNCSREFGYLGTKSVPLNINGHHFLLKHAKIMDHVNDVLID